MGFQDIKDWFSQQKTSLQDSITRYKNRDFSDAVVAGCALVAAADGKIDSSEKQKMIGYMQRSPELKVFDIKDIIQRFNEIVEGFDFDHTIGKGEALKIIGKLKSNQEAARLLIRVCCAIGMADGDFNETEKKAVQEICVELGLPPTEFGLQV